MTKSFIILPCKFLWDKIFIGDGKMKQVNRIAVIIEFDSSDPSEYKYTAYCPSLPACFSEGRTREEVLKNIREVITAYLDIMEEELANKDFEVIEVVR